MTLRLRFDSSRWKNRPICATGSRSEGGDGAASAAGLRAVQAHEGGDQGLPPVRVDGEVRYRALKKAVGRIRHGP